MIHSSIKDNWMRVEIMHYVAQTYFTATDGSDFRTRITQKGALFPFNTIQYGQMEKESCLVGMVMAWSVITLESLVNHALAEIYDKDSSIEAIEYPSQTAKRLKIAKDAKSELAKKIAILSDHTQYNNEYILLANEISDIRNVIVHDKPFDLIDTGDGEVKITHFRKRGSDDKPQTRYENLPDFYKKCDKICGYINSILPLEVMGLNEISFIKLMNEAQPQI